MPGPERKPDEAAPETPEGSGAAEASPAHGEVLPAEIHEVDEGSLGADATEGAERTDAGAGPEEAREGRESPPADRSPDPRDVRIRSLEQLLADREATLHEYIKAHKKAEKETEAFRSRLLRDQEVEVTAARARVVERLLDVFDNLDRTLDAVRHGGSRESLQAGVELVRKQFAERMEEMGLRSFDPAGEPFDPGRMEALAVVPVDDPAKDGRVLATIKPGFRFDGRELRPALVQVGRRA